jgi:SAM-dependent methyltransferase
MIETVTEDVGRPSQGTLVRGGARRSDAATASAERALLERDRHIRGAVARWHFAMLNDGERSASYELALATFLRPNMHVLDIGCGSGLLGMLAAKHGASRVTSCEVVPEIAEVARRIVGSNGFADRVVVVPKPSTSLSVAADLPRRADLLVTEIIDCGLVGEGIMPTLRHAREHLLAEGGSIIPRAATVYATLIESAPIHELNLVGSSRGVDVRLFNELSSRLYFPVRSHTWPYRFLSPAATAFEVDFLRDPLEPTTREVSFTVKQSGTCHAIMFWFDLELAPGVSLRNQPGDQKTHWMQAVQCVEHAFDVRAGEALTLTVLQTDSALRFATH